MPGFFIVSNNESSGTYECCLLILIELFDRDGSVHWAQGLREDLQLWRTKGVHERHRGKYGGMGSFNDCYLGQSVSSGITKGEQPRAEVLRRCVQVWSYGYCMRPYERASASELLGRYANEFEAVHGWLCAECRLLNASTAAIARTIAARVVPTVAAEAIARDEVECLVDRVLAADLPNAATLREQASRALRAIGIQVHESITWEKTCGQCGGVKIESRYYELHECDNGTLRAAIRS